jgi:hypothetical protein
MIFMKTDSVEAVLYIRKYMTFSLHFSYFSISLGNIWYGKCQHEAVEGL